MLSLLTQTPKYNVYKKVALQSQEHKIEHSKKMKKRKTLKKHNKINIQIVQNSYLNEKIKEQAQLNKFKTSENKDLVVVMPYNEFRDLVDLAQKGKRGKTTIKRKVTFIKMAQQAKSIKLPSINREQTVSLQRAKTNNKIQSQPTKSTQLDPRRKINKRINRVKTQVSNYTQQLNNELSKQKFDDFMANIKQKVMESSFHIQKGQM